MRLFFAILSAAILLGGCSHKNCDKLVELACKRLDAKEDGAEKCALIREQSKSADNDTCGETLRLLKKSGQLQKQRK
jgi:hypothetical protein